MICIRSPFQQLFNSLSKVMDVIDKTGSTVIDTFRYREGDCTYKQTVYRLKDHSIYVETDLAQDDGLVMLKARLTKAIREERYEDAATLRDEIKSRREKKE